VIPQPLLPQPLRANDGVLPVPACVGTPPFPAPLRQCTPLEMLEQEEDGGWDSDPNDEQFSEEWQAYFPLRHAMETVQIFAHALGYAPPPLPTPPDSPPPPPPRE
jgi:hypothetical protein